MSSPILPVSEDEIAQAVAAAAGKGTPLRVIGAGTRDGLGHPVRARNTLSLARLSGISLYEPGALTIIAKAGTPLAEIEKTLAGENQRLAFEPMDHRSLFSSKGRPTIGGIVGANISGPRRVQAGACRDSLIGVRFVNGQGQVIKSGGRVMKNVTGLDLVKLMAGSFGTLGVLSEVSFKVLPRNEREASLVVSGLDLKTAIKVFSGALGSPFEITGAAFLPQTLGSKTGGSGPSRTVLRVEGFESQVDYRLERLRKIVAGRIGSRGDHDMETIEGKSHEDLWQAIRDVRIFKGTGELVFRMHIKPGDAPAISQAIGNALGRETGSRMLFDWGGGLVWLGTDINDAADTIRSIVDGFGGHVTLVRAPDQVRLSVPVFHPRQRRIAEISECIRNKFDPRGVLNPGRMQLAHLNRGGEGE